MIKSLIKLPHLETLKARYEYLNSIGLSYGPIYNDEENYSYVFQTVLQVDDPTMSDIYIINKAIKCNNSSINDRLLNMREIDSSSSESDWLEEFNDSVDTGNWQYINSEHKKLGAYKKGLDANILVDIKTFSNAIKNEFSQEFRSSSNANFLHCGMDSLENLVFSTIVDEDEDEDYCDWVLEFLAQKGITEKTFARLKKQIHGWLFAGYTYYWYELSASYLYLALGRFQGIGTMIVTDTEDNSKECLFFDIYSEM